MMKSKSKNPICLGCCYRVPADAQALIIVMVAAANKRGAAFGYFFQFDSTIEFDESLLHTLSPQMAIIRHKFGDLGIYNGEWPLVGKMDNFDPEIWPFSPCVQKDEQAGIAYIKHYDADTFRCIKLTKIDIAEPSIQLLPEDSLWGHKVAEIKVARLVAGN